MKKHLPTRLLCLALAAVMVLGLFPAVQAASEGLHWELTNETIPLDRSDRLIQDRPQEPTPGPTDPVRVSIVLEGKATLRSGFTAGDLTIRKGSRAAAANCLRTQAELMMAPYLKDRFSFRGV